jgi:hypothetical protein
VQLEEEEDSAGQSESQSFLGGLWGGVQSAVGAVAEAKNKGVAETKNDLLRQYYKLVGNPRLEKLDTNIEALKYLHGLVLVGHGGSALDTGKAWKNLDEGKQNTYKRYYEAGMVGKIVPHLIDKSRQIVKSLTTADIEERKLKETKSAYHRELNALSTYYTQMANLDILTNVEEEKPAWRRTCNVTSLAMALEALGVSAGHFEGDRELLTQVANHFDPDAFNDFSDVASLRLPDFLQFVAIYLNLPKSGKFAKRYKKGWKKARKSYILSSKNFLKMAKEFGVTESSREGTKWSRLEKKTDPVAAYKQKIVSEVGPELAKGAQVIVNRTEPSKHFVRLEDLTDDGVIIDDPAEKGKNALLSWKAAYEGRYFNKYVVLNK